MITTRKVHKKRSQAPDAIRRVPIKTVKFRVEIRLPRASAKAEIIINKTKTERSNNFYDTITSNAKERRLS